MESDQRNARIFGVLFILTFLTSIPAALLFQSVIDDPAGFIAGGGNLNQIYLAVLLEFALIIANVGTAVVLYPIARRQDKILALGYVTARIIECVFIAAGIIFVLGIVSLRQTSPGRHRPGRVACGAQGLDGPVWPWLRRPVWERADTRLSDVQVRPRTAENDLVRTDRGADPSDWEHRHARGWVGSRQRAPSPPGSPGVHLGGLPGHLLHYLGVSTRLTNPSGERALTSDTESALEFVKVLQFAQSILTQ